MESRFSLAIALEGLANWTEGAAYRPPGTVFCIGKIVGTSWAISNLPSNSGPNAYNWFQLGGDDHVIWPLVYFSQLIPPGTHWPYGFNVVPLPT